MLARLLIFFGVPLTVLPLVFRWAVVHATAQAEQNLFAPQVSNMLIRVRRICLRL